MAIALKLFYRVVFTLNMYVWVGGREEGQNTPLLIVSEPSGSIIGKAYIS